MSVLDDPRVSEINGGYRVDTETNGPLTVFPQWGGWAVFFGDSTVDNPHPTGGMGGSNSTTAEEAIEWALR